MKKNKMIDLAFIIIPIVVIMLILLGVILVLIFNNDTKTKPVKSNSYKSILLKTEDGYSYDEEELKDFEGKLLTNYSDYDELTNKYDLVGNLTKED